MNLEAPPTPQEPPPPPADQEYPADYPGEDPTLPKQRQAGPAPMMAYSNFAQAAIALLLHQPKVAQMGDPARLNELEGEDIGLLRELLDLLRRRPESNTAMLLGHWYGTPEGDLLSRLAGQERLIPTEGIEQQFVDTIETLSQLPHRSKLTAQVDKLKLTNYAEVSELEKQRLRELLQDKLRRDAERNKRK
jgi:DNA primase